MSDIIIMNNEELLLEIKNEICSLVNNKTSPKEAENIFKRLEESCKTLEAEIKIPKPSLESALTGLLYRHNTENFAKLTLVFRKAEELFVPFAYTGALQFISVVEKIIKTNIDAIEDRRLSCFETQDAAGMRYKFFFDCIKNNNDEFIIASSVSSAYSSQKKFDESAKEIGHYLLEQINVSSDSFDYLERLKKYLTNYLQINLSLGKNMKAVLFSFDSFNRMLRHKGIMCMIFISNMLFSKLEDFYGTNTLITAIQLDSFIVIFPDDDDSAEGPKSNFFTHNDITLKFSKSGFQLTSVADLNSVWLEIGKKRFD